MKNSVEHAFFFFFCLLDKLTIVHHPGGKCLVFIEGSKTKTKYRVNQFQYECKPNVIRQVSVKIHIDFIFVCKKTWHPK